MITILLFANLREEVGSDRLVISEKQEMTVQQLSNGSKPAIVYNRWIK